MELISSIHRISHWFLLALVALHLGAVAWHWIARRDLLVRAMLWATGTVDAEPAADNSAIRLRAVVLLTLSVALVAYSVML